MRATTYGYETGPDGDSLISRATEAINIPRRVLAPERAALMMAFPFRTCQTYAVTIHTLNFLAVEYLPSWFPLAADRRLAPYCRKIVRQMLDEPFEIAKKNIVCRSALSFGALTEHRLDWGWATVIYSGQIPQR
jgi:hypothetical protein